VFPKKNSAASITALIQKSSMISFLAVPGGPDSSKICLIYSISCKKSIKLGYY